MDRQGAAAQPFLIRVISLARSPRRAIFTERAQTTLEWDFLDARTSNTTGLPYDARKSERIYGRALKPSELGCFSSHHALWQLCAKAGRPLIVFEDDVDPHWPFLEAFACDYQAYAGIDFLRFRGTFDTERVAVGDILDRKLLEALGYPRGGQGYLLTPAHAKRLLIRLRLLARPVDDEIDRVWRYGGRNLLVDPPALSPRDEPSDIGDLGRNEFIQTGMLRTALRVFEKLQKETYISCRRLQLRAPAPR
jgi:glycosyl transferase family 25